MVIIKGWGRGKQKKERRKEKGERGKERGMKGNGGVEKEEERREN